MAAPKWYLPTVSEIIALSEQHMPGELWVAAEVSASEGGRLEKCQGTKGGLRDSPAETLRDSTVELLRDRDHNLARRRTRAEREWYGAVGAVNDLLRSLLPPSTTETKPALLQGIVLSGSAPILENSDLLAHLSAWTFIPGATPDATNISYHLLPAARKPGASASTPATLPLAIDDPLAGEQFCIIMTERFSLAMSLGTDADGFPVFLFSFVPEVVWKAWRSLQSRLQMNHLPILPSLTALVEQFPPVEPHYRTVTQFQRLMLTHLPDVPDGSLSPREGRRSRRRPRLQRWNAVMPPPNSPSGDGASSPPNLNHPANPKLDPVAWDSVMNKGQRIKRHPARSSTPASGNESPAAKSSLDLELLQAIAHEVRTPLTTIRTLTRLLLRRKDLHADVVKRLSLIDRECTEQIDRFNLIFRAVELETKPTKAPQTPLAAISLDQLFEHNIPRWQTQASQHSLTLDVSMPQKLPMVVSDPTMLEQVLTGLIDRITHTLPAGSHIQIEVALAGHQLKLQFQAESQDRNHPADFIAGLSSYFAPTLKSIGNLLMFQPETGNLSLNLAVTKNLFQALGGKLTVRHRPQQGEILTIFLPLQD